MSFKAVNNPKTLYTGYRDLAEIICYAAGVYFRFTLRYRDVEELLAARDIVVVY